jgi:hypothetical protein
MFEELELELIQTQMVRKPMLKTFLASPVKSEDAS